MRSNRQKLRLPGPVGAVCVTLALVLVGGGAASARTSPTPQPARSATATSTTSPTGEGTGSGDRGPGASLPTVSTRTSTSEPTVGADGRTTVTVRVDATTTAAGPSASGSTTTAGPTASSSTPASSSRTASPGDGTIAEKYLGKGYRSQSGKAYMSGVWAPPPEGKEKEIGKSAIDFTKVRGAPVDAVTIYTSRETWDGLGGSCGWMCDYTTDFKGRLIVGVSLTRGKENGGTPSEMNDVVAGKHDDQYKKVASDLVKRGRGNSIIRIGLEANAEGWFPWGVNTPGSSPELFKAAFNHVAAIFAAASPDFLIAFDISLGTPIPGESDPAKMFELLYPGDKYVNLVGADIYDMWETRVATPEEFQQKIVRPTEYTGVQDIVRFARQKGLGVIIPEWGNVAKHRQGGGDNKIFMEEMVKLFDSISDVLVLEAIFCDPASDNVDNDLRRGKYPQSAEAYKRHATSGDNDRSSAATPLDTRPSATPGDQPAAGATAAYGDRSSTRSGAGSGNRSVTKPTITSPTRATPMDGAEPN